LVVFDRELRHIATRPLGHNLGQRAYYIPPATLVTDERTIERSGRYLMVTVLDTAGPVTATLEPRSDPVEAMIVAPAFGGGFWTLKVNGTELHRYSPAASLTGTYSLSIAGFQPFETALPGNPLEGYTVPFRPLHKELMDLGNELLVITTIMPSPDFRLWPLNMNSTEIDRNKDIITQVTLIDLRTEATIASQRVPGMIWWSVHGTRDMIYSTRLDPNGHVITTIWRITGRRPDAR
jgi:hypothetical protein